MPAVLPIAGALFIGAGSIAGAVAASVTIAGIALSTVLTVVGVALLAISFLTIKKPKPQSQGQQLDLKLDPAAPVSITFGRTAVGGTLIFRRAFGPDNVSLVMAIALSAGGPIHAFHGHTVNDRAANYAGDPWTSQATVNSVQGLGSGSKLYKGHMKLRVLAGDAPSTTTIDAASAGGAAGAGLASGHALAVMRCEYDQEAFSGGLPASKFIISGVRAYDPREDSTYSGGSGSQRRDDPTTWTFTENPFLQALLWTRGRYENGFKVWGIGAEWDEIDVPAFVAGANVADSNGWKSGGQVTTDDNKFAVLNTILQAGGGKAIQRGAQISCSVQTPRTSLRTITEADLLDEIEIQTTTSWRARKNVLIPRYREEVRNWEMVEADQITAQAYRDQDDGELREAEFEIPFCQDKTQAQELAAYELANMREFLTFKIKCKPTMLDLNAGDCVTADLPSFAVSDQKCIVVNREYDAESFTVALTLKAETDDKHAFALGQSATPPTPAVLGSYDPSQATGPQSGDWAADTDTIQDAAGNRQAALKVYRVNVPTALTQSVILEYRKANTSDWNHWGSFDRSTTAVTVTGLESDTSYEIGVSYRTVNDVVTDRLILTQTSGTAAAGQVIDPETGQPAVIGEFGFLNDISITDDRILDRSLENLDPSAGNKLASIESGATAGDNLLVNGNFGDGLTGLTVLDSGTSVGTLHQPTNDAPYLENTGSTGSTRVYFTDTSGFSTNLPRASSGETLFFSLQGRSASIQRRRVYAHCYSPNGTLVSSILANEGTTNTGSNWLDEYATILVPSGVAFINVWVEVFGGSQPNAIRNARLARTFREADATSLNSEFRTMDVGARSSENLIRDPQFSAGEKFFKVQSSAAVQLVTDANDTYFTKTASGSGVVQSLVNDAPEDTFITVRSGATYSVSAEILNTTGGLFRLNTRQWNGNSAGGVIIAGSTAAVSNTWTDLSGAITIDSDKNLLQVSTEMFTVGQKWRNLRLAEVEKGATVGSRNGVNFYLEDGTTVGTDADVVTGSGIAAGFVGQAPIATDPSFANIESVPAELTDGRIDAGLDSNGDLKRALPNGVKIQSDLVTRGGGGGNFVGDLDADRAAGAGLSFVDSSAATKLNSVEDNADVTALAQRVVISQFPQIEIRENEAGNIGNRNVTHFARAGASTMTGGTWTLESVLLGDATLTINAATGTVTASGIQQSGSYTVRYTHTDTIYTELTVNVSFVETQSTVRSISPSVSVVGWFEGTTTSATVTHTAREGSTDLTGGTWSKVTSNTGTVSVTSGTGSTSITDVTSSGFYTIRYAHSDSVETEKTVNIEFYPSGNSGGPPPDPDYNEP